MELFYIIMNKNEQEKIIELLQSKDLELRMLGLSYLNEDKNNPNLYIKYNNKTNNFNIVKISGHPICYCYSFDHIYRSLFNIHDTFSKKYLLLYVNYCIKR